MAVFVSHHLFQRAGAVFPHTGTQRRDASAMAFWGCREIQFLFTGKILFGSPLHKLGNRMRSESGRAVCGALTCRARQNGDLAGDAQRHVFLRPCAISSTIRLCLPLFLILC